MDESTQPPPASTSHSEARNLLLLQDYVRNVSQLMLEQTSASLQTTEILTGIFSEHDLRTLRTACQCLHSLRIRVEARANTVERAMIEQQLQFMQTRVQPVPTEDLRAADTTCPVDRGLTANARRHCPDGTQCQKISPAPVSQKTRTTQRRELLYAIQPSRSNDQAPRRLL